MIAEIGLLIVILILLLYLVILYSVDYFKVDHKFVLKCKYGPFNISETEHLFIYLENDHEDPHDAIEDIVNKFTSEWYAKLASNDIKSKLATLYDLLISYGIKYVEYNDGEEDVIFAKQDSAF